MNSIHRFLAMSENESTQITLPLEQFYSSQCRKPSPPSDCFGIVGIVFKYDDTCRMIFLLQLSVILFRSEIDTFDGFPDKFKIFKNWLAFFIIRSVFGAYSSLSRKMSFMSSTVCWRNYLFLLIKSNRHWAITISNWYRSLCENLLAESWMSVSECSKQCGEAIQYCSQSTKRQHHTVRMRII